MIAAVLPFAGPGADPETAASGFMGFVVFFLLALAIWFLGRNLTGRLRRMNHLHAQEEAERTQEAPSELEGHADPSAGPDDRPQAGS